MHSPSNIGSQPAKQTTQAFFMTDKLLGLFRRKKATPSSPSSYLTVMHGADSSSFTTTKDFESREMKPLQIGSDFDDLKPTGSDLHYSEIHGTDNDDYEVDGIFIDNNNAHSKSSAAREPWAWWMSDRMHQYWFPESTPRICQLFRAENMAIPACYLLVGLLQGLSAVAVNVTEAQQTTMSGIRSLPASFKLLFGFLSDVAPIGGYRRKPYMMAGWGLASLSMVLLMTGSNLNIPSGDQGCFSNTSHNQVTEMPSDTPTIPFLCICFLLFGTGFWMADVMADSVVAEKAKFESDAQRGSIQSTCYSFRFFGLMAAAPVSTAMYTFLGPKSVIFVLSLMPLSVLPLVYLLYENPHARVPTATEQCREIWSTVCSRAVWQPLAFVYLYNVMQVGMYVLVNGGRGHEKSPPVDDG
jgi:MFS family permease